MQNSSKQASNRQQHGQGMMEYIIIVAMIAVAAIGVYGMFGKSIRNQTAGMAKEIAGVDAKTEIGAAASAAGSAATRGDKSKGMAQYNSDNDH